VQGESEERLELVRATVNLPGLRAGRRVLVNPELPRVKGYLDSTALVRVIEGNEAAEPTRGAGESA